MVELSVFVYCNWESPAFAISRTGAKKVGLGSNISKEDLVLRKINFHLQYYWLWSRENYHAIRLEVLTFSCTSSAGPNNLKKKPFPDAMLRGLFARKNE